MRSIVLALLAAVLVLPIASAAAIPDPQLGDRWAALIDHVAAEVDGSAEPLTVATPPVACTPVTFPGCDGIELTIDAAGIAADNVRAFRHTGYQIERQFDSPLER